ncbi:hypothetical protein [Leifsonia shinshuensis]
MTNTHRLAAIATGAAVIGLLLVGCTTPSPSPSSSTKVPTPSPTPTSTAFEPSGDPGKAAAPKDAEAAYTAANKTIGDFLNVRAQIMAETGAKPERITPYADGAALQLVQNEASQEASKGITVSGVPGWEPDASKFSAGTATIGASTVPFGSATVEGCYDTSKQTWSGGGEGSSVRRGPVKFSVYYVETEKSWKVFSLESLQGQAGAPTC